MTKDGSGRRCFAVFDHAAGGSLAILAEALLERQRRGWPDLAAGYAALAESVSREIRSPGWGVRLQLNPRRIASSGASVDSETIRRRRCFLCADHLPPEQQAILYRDEYLVLCNPMPIFPGHLTIAHRRHLPQSLPANLPALLSLSRDLGPQATLLYNGPRAGASAPDHLHFQAVPAGLLPAEAELLDPRKRTAARRKGGVAFCRTIALGRGAVVIDGADEAALCAAVRTVVGALARQKPSDDEPPLNILCNRTADGWRLLLYPRRRHRPEAYDRPGDERLLISPGAVDMGGVIVAAREKEYRELTPELVGRIYREVAFDDEALEALLDRCTA